MTNILRINNDYSFFLSDDLKLRQELHERLRFRDKNYFHNRAYKMKKWDGYINFFSLDTGKFLTGLLPEVSAVLRHFNAEYSVEDLRQKTSFCVDAVNKDFLNQWLPETNTVGDKISSLELHDYQVEFINLTMKHRRGVIFAPTSAGKSLVMLGILKTLAPNTPTLVLQNRTSLAQQNYDEFTKWKLPNVGGLWGGVRQAEHDHRGDGAVSAKDGEAAAEDKGSHRR